MATGPQPPSYNPYESPSASSQPGPARLGSLAQSARQKQLNTARGILLAVGILSTAVNGFLFATIEKQADDAINAEIQKLPRGMVANPAEVVQAKTHIVRIGQLLHGGFLVVSLLFIVLGLIVKKYPVPITVIGLVLYIGSAAVAGILEPTTLVQGIIVKAIVVVALIKSIQSAIAYERDRSAVKPQGLQPLA